MHWMRRLSAAIGALTLSAGILSAQSSRDSLAIVQLYRDLPQAVAASDVDGIMSLMDDSITVLVPGVPPIEGPQAYRAGLAPMFSTAEVRLRLAMPLRLWIAGPLAFVHYTGVLVTIPKAAGDSVRSPLRYVDILRRQPDGSWRLFLHSFQNDATVNR